MGVAQELLAQTVRKSAETAARQCTALLRSGDIAEISGTRATIDLALGATDENGDLLSILVSDVAVLDTGVEVLPGDRVLLLQQGSSFIVLGKVQQ